MYFTHTVSTSGEYSLSYPIQASERSGTYSKGCSDFCSSLAQLRSLTPFKDSDFTPLKSLPLPNAKPESNHEEASGKPNQKTFYKTHDFESSQGSRLWMADWSMVPELGMLTKGTGHPGFPTVFFFFFLLYSVTGKIWITSISRVLVSWFW